MQSINSYTTAVSQCDTNLLFVAGSASTSDLSTCSCALPAVQCTPLASSTDTYTATQAVLQQQQQQPFNGRLSGTTRVGRYQKKHSPAHTHPDQSTFFITFLHLQWSTASSLFSLRAWQSSQITSFQVLFGLPLGLEHTLLCFRLMLLSKMFN